jgi:hypothetical protein
MNEEELETDDDDDEEELETCVLICQGKVHHATREAAAEHVAELRAAGSPNAYLYDCECPAEWLNVDGDREGPGPHFHVASSPIRRKDRDRISE